MFVLSGFKGLEFAQGEAQDVGGATGGISLCEENEEKREIMKLGAIKLIYNLRWGKRIRTRFSSRGTIQCLCVIASSRHRMAVTQESVYWGYWINIEVRDNFQLTLLALDTCLHLWFSLLLGPDFSRPLSICRNWTKSFSFSRDAEACFLDQSIVSFQKILSFICTRKKTRGHHVRIWDKIHKVLSASFGFSSNLETETLASWSLDLKRGKYDEFLRVL